jgi:rhomboid domain-containing protein 1
MARSVGFSGVLFCLKYLLNLVDGDNIVMLYGINICRKYVVFFELLMITIMVPNTSFSGHLFGILTGMIMNFFNLV